MSTINFDDGTNPSITLPSPEYPAQDAQILDQSVQQAMGGRITSITRGSGVLRRWKLMWNTLPESDYNTLVTFLYTTISGAANPFTFTDHNSDQYVVKYIGGLERSQLIDFDSRKVEIELAEAV